MQLPNAPIRFPRRSRVWVATAFSPAVALMIGGYLTALAGAEGAPKAPATQPASAPAASQPAKDGEIRALVAQLGSPDFKTRESAQARLSQIGESAMPVLVEFVGSKDPEIANRIAALIKRPRNPELRVETAVRLLATTDPDWMEMGVYMVFESPVEDYDLFVERTKDASGLQRAIFKPVAEQLKEWRDTTIRHRDRQKALLADGREETAEKERGLHHGSMYYQAEAAYAYAIEAVEQAADTALSPVGTTQPAASQPAESNPG